MNNKWLLMTICSIGRLHRANPIVAQVEAEAAIGSSHHFTIGGELLVNHYHPELVVSW